jgi:hypothetical protein
MGKGFNASCSEIAARCRAAEKTTNRYKDPGVHPVDKAFGTPSISHPISYISDADCVRL